MPSAARQSIEAMRALLEAPPRDEALWMRLNKNQRAALLMMAGLRPVWSSRFWRHFTQSEKIKILDQVQHAATWQQKLQGPA